MILAMATKKRTAPRTGKRAATAASRTLRNPKATGAAKAAAGSTLGQTGRAARTGTRAASAAGRALARKVTSREGRKSAGSALAQTPRKAKRRTPKKVAKPK
jgi:hypothetical protein